MIVWKLDLKATIDTKINVLKLNLLFVAFKIHIYRFLRFD